VEKRRISTVWGVEGQIVRPCSAFYSQNKKKHLAANDLAKRASKARAGIPIGRCENR
jgi:hypothetical protein